MPEHLLTQEKQLWRDYKTYHIIPNWQEGNNLKNMKKLNDKVVASTIATMMNPSSFIIANTNALLFKLSSGILKCIVLWDVYNHAT